MAATLVVGLVRSTFSTLAPDEGMTKDPLLWFCVKLISATAFTSIKEKNYYSRSSSKCSGKVDIYYEIAAEACSA
jgi:hypothetical protein